MVDLSTTTSHPKPTPHTRPPRRRKRNGGWPTTTGLDWQQVKDILDLAHRARFNVILHIMPDEGTDAERKRFVAKTVGHLGQKLKRRGQEHSGVTIYEKGPTADLHGHHLVLVDKTNYDLLKRYDGYVVRVEFIPSQKLKARVTYCTKQRKPLPPELEAQIRKTHPRQKGLPFRGQRASYTTAAKALMLEF